MTLRRFLARLIGTRSICIDKIDFPMFQSDERLAALATRVYPSTQMLRKKYEGGAVECDLLTQTGRWAAENLHAKLFCPLIRCWAPCNGIPRP